MKKIIGLTGPSAFSKQCSQMIENYLESNFINLVQDNEDNLCYWLDNCDGFLIAGGVDIHPSLYGLNVVSGANLSKFDIQRDIKELKIINYALKKSKPILAICRGHQLLSIALGLQNEFAVDLTSTLTVHQPNFKNITPTEYDVMHYVDIINPEYFPIKECEERQVISEILGVDEKNRVWVNSFHHQGIIYLGNKHEQHYSEKGIVVVGISAAEFEKKRYLIELMVDKNKNWISTQWHPEYDYEVNTPSKTVLDIFYHMLNK